MRKRIGAALIAVALAACAAPQANEATGAGRRDVLFVRSAQGLQALSAATRSRMMSVSGDAASPDFSVIAATRYIGFEH